MNIRLGDGSLLLQKRTVPFEILGEIGAGFDKRA